MNTPVYYFTVKLSILQQCPKLWAKGYGEVEFNTRYVGV